MDIPEAITIGQALRNTRLQRGLTLQQVGELLGTTKASVSKLELSPSITFKKLESVCRVIGVRPSEVVALTENIFLDPREVIESIIDSPEIILPPNVLERAQLAVGRIRLPRRGEENGAEIVADGG